MRIDADDELYRVRAVWLGPEGFTFPFFAEYRAWGTFLSTFLAILLFIRLTPLDVSIPPIRELIASLIITQLIMLAVDQERTVRSIPLMLWAELQAFLHNTLAPRHKVKKIDATTIRVWGK